jgi:steroid 5-alpha reductase family enzyme
MGSVVTLLPTAAAFVFIYMTVLFLVAQSLRNNSIVDIGWGFGFIVVVAAQFIQNPVVDPAKILMTACLVIWVLRLATHILRRNWGKPEDFRYAAMRKRWGRHAAVKAFFSVFMLQGLLLLAVSFPVTVLFAAPPRPLTVLDLAGALVFLFGFLFETIGDAQLAAHVADPANRGRLMTRGLWSLTRHPNYFGEATLWWGIALIALSSPRGWAAFLGPVTITLLLLFVSGVPLLEKKYAGRPDWEEYKKATPKLFPRIFRKSTSRRFVP